MMRPKSIRGAWGAACVLAVAVAAFPAGAAGQAPPAGDAEIGERIRFLVETGTGAVASGIRVAEERIHAYEQLPRFYERRAFRPAWTGAVAGSAADSLIAALERAEHEGVNPADYHLNRIRALLQRDTGDEAVPSDTRLAGLDLLLTDAFLLYGAHLVSGRVDPVRIHAEWNAASPEADLVSVLEAALETGRIGGALETLLPVDAGYGRLRDLLGRYRHVAAAGGWPTVPGRTLRPGDRGDDIATLRRRLALSGDLAPDLADGDTYDDAVVAAVERFQRRHALPPDGLTGLSTSALLNVPVEDRIRQIELNLERWRWLPRALGTRYILVNIAGYEVELVDGDSTLYRGRAMVGQPYRRTPVFSDRMTYLVLNPTWTIPPNILEVDKLPLIREDPSYLASNQIQVLAPDGREVDPSTIDWSAVRGNTSYRLRMAPGPENPLGQVKFMFPNPYHIYLHDTPDRDLFDRTNRAFSSGCIRVENALDLAAILLRDASWTPERIRAALTRPGEQTVPLRQPVPVHLLYWTVWVDRDGQAHFRPDIYDRDAVLDAALREPPPMAAAGDRLGGPVPGPRWMVPQRNPFATRPLS